MVMKKSFRVKTIYIPEEDFDMMDVLEEMFKVDEKIIKKKVKNRNKAFAIMTRMLWKYYYNQKKEEFLSTKNETNKDKN